MKRILLLALSLVLITTANLKSQNVNPNTEIIIGEGTNTTTSLPINTNYRYNYSQQLYLASEMGGRSVIDKIYLQYMSAETTRTIDIYMGNTDKTSFSSGSDHVSLEDMSLVFSGTITFNNSSEWFEIILDTPFVYDGVSSLVIAFDDNTGSYTSSYAFKYHDNSNYCSLYYTSDNTNSNPASPADAQGNTLLNNIKLSM